jgi:peptidoglycan/xylan/chitin deacetylase (PgdA/CDA1 family)
MHARVWRRGGKAIACSVALCCGLVALLVSGHPAHAASHRGGDQPLGIRSAGLVQDGLDLRFTLTMMHSFSPTALMHGGNTLCLLIGRPARRQVCVVPPNGRHRPPRLTLSVKGGRARVIHANVRRPSTSSLQATFKPAAIALRYHSVRWQVQSALAPTRCAGTGGATTTPNCPPARYPAHPALVKLHTPKLVGCVPRGPSLVFHGPSRRHDIALSFDDGPWPDPPSIDFVRLLARYHVPATFFEIGDQISEYDRTGKVERLMLKDGDMIGDHTWTHPDMLGLSVAQQTSQLQRTNHAIRRATGFTPCLWRPPYGDTNGPLESLARRLGMLTIYWDIDPRDWSLPGVAAIERTVIDNAHNGGITEMHFGGGPRYETYQALPDIIRTLRRRGYHFVNIAQMLGLRLIYR